MPRLLLLFFLGTLFLAVVQSETNKPKSLRDNSSINRSSRGPTRTNLRTLAAHMNADAVRNTMRHFVNRRLALSTIQALFDAHNYKRSQVQVVDLLNQLHSRLERTLNLYMEALDRAKAAVLKQLSNRHGSSHATVTQFTQCCRIPATQLRYDGQFEEEVNRSISCDILSPAAPHIHSLLFRPANNLTSVYRHHARTLSALRWQYFVSNLGSHVEYPAHRQKYTRFNAEHGYCSCEMATVQMGQIFRTDECLAMISRRHRRQFLATALPFPKRIVILLEYGSWVSASQLERLKAVALSLVDCLSPHDRVTVAAPGARCTNGPPKLEPANATTRQRLKERIRAFTPSTEPTNHSLAFDLAFRTLASSSSTLDNERHFIFYVTRGLLSSIHESPKVLEKIAALELETALTNVQINTVPIFESSKPPLFELQFLRLISDQNFEKYSESFDPELRSRIGELKLNPPTGKMIVVNGSVDAALDLHTVYTSFLRQSERDPPSTNNPIRLKWHQADPYHLSMTNAVWHSGRFVGVVGQDVSVSALATPLRHTLTEDAHAILLDHNGSVLNHPLLRSENGLSEHRKWDTSVPLYTLDNWSTEDREECFQKLLRRNTGSCTVRLSDGDTKGKQSTRNYVWRKLSHAPLVLVYSSTSNTTGVRGGSDGGSLSYSARIFRHATYHRLDLRLDAELNGRHCLNYGRLATYEKGGVYLSPRCFKRPEMQLRERGPSRIPGESRAAATAYWAYLVHRIGLIPNPGLAPAVREDASVLAAVLPHWIQLWKSVASNDDGREEDGVIRRFLVSSSGVMVTYPAEALHPAFEPTETDWYLAAMAKPGRVAVTAPTIDPSGIGYVVTLSIAVAEGKAASLHSASDPPVAVDALQISVNYLYKLLVTQVKACKLPHKRCLILDIDGYLAARGDPLADFNTPTTNGTTTRKEIFDAGATVAGAEPPEAQHFTHREPQLAWNMLRQDGLLVSKHFCLADADTVVRRSYRLNRTLHDAVTIEADAGCSDFEVTPIPAMDLFLVVITRRCQASRPHSAFCPCSVTDRRCLLCAAKADPSDCECPCECATATAPPCGRAARATTMLRCRFADSVRRGAQLGRLLPLSKSLLKVLTPRSTCDGSIATAADAKEHCESVEDYIGCLSESPRCEWCVRKSDGKHPLSTPMCLPTASCFGGVLGRGLFGKSARSSMPLGDADDLAVVTTPVGPVAGAIMFIFVVLVIVVYCYRHQVTRFVESRQRAGSGARLHLAVCDEEDYHFDHDGSSPPPSINSEPAEAKAALLAPSSSMVAVASFERQDGTVPRARPHRPGPLTESSDHGYSTMTDRNADDKNSDLGLDPLHSPLPPPPAKYSLLSPPAEQATAEDLDCSSATLLADTAAMMTSPDTTLTSSVAGILTVEAQVHSPPVLDGPMMVS